MQKILPAAIILFMLFLYSCNQKKTSEPSLQIQVDPPTEQTFFPVTEYIRSQLKELDTLPVTPLKIVEANGKTDSIWMKKEDIRPFAEPFLHPTIDSSTFKNLFTQISFLDQTINSVTLSYDPSGKLPDTLQLRRWDVYIDPQKNTIQRIYILKELNNNGTIKTLQLTWKSNQWCKITTITEQNGKQDTRSETMKWDFNE